MEDYIIIQDNLTGKYMKVPKAIFFDRLQVRAVIRDFKDYLNNPNFKD